MHYCIWNRFTHFKDQRQYYIKDSPSSEKKKSSFWRENSGLWDNLFKLKVIVLEWLITIIKSYKYYEEAHWLLLDYSELVNYIRRNNTNYIISNSLWTTFEELDSARNFFAKNERMNKNEIRFFPIFKHTSYAKEKSEIFRW